MSIKLVTPSILFWLKNGRLKEMTTLEDFKEYHKEVASIIVEYNEPKERLVGRILHDCHFTQDPYDESVWHVTYTDESPFHEEEE